MSTARIHDQGYRRYEGERIGVSGAMVSLGLHATQRVLGLKRRFRTKVLPAIILLVSYTPAVVLVGMSAFLSDLDVAQDFIPYEEYYDIIALAILLFVAFVAPEALCTDRRSGMLSLYLSSPLTRDTYLLAKAAAVFGVLLAVTLGPPLLLLLAYTLADAGPDSVAEFFELLVQILAAGLFVSLLPTSISVGISSFTARRAFASAGIAISLIATNILSSVLTAEEGRQLGAGYGMLNLFWLPFEGAYRIFGERSEAPGLGDLATGWVFAANVAWAAAFAGFARFQYQKVSVDR